MRRSFALPLAALIGAASAAPISLAAASSPEPTTSDSPAPATAAERYGTVRYDSAARRWTILSTPAFRSAGLNGVSCAPASGVLTVTFTPLTSIGTFTVDEDDAYAGRYAAGAAITTRSMAITFRKPSTGAAVSCNAAELRIAGSGLQLWVRGEEGTPPTSPTVRPPSSRPTPEPPTSPTPTAPATTRPTAPTTAPPTTAPPTSPPPTDPADSAEPPPPVIG